MASQYDIPWHMLKGLDPANSEFCTLKGSVTTGMEPSARDEIAVKLRSVAYCARGRVFFDVKMDQVNEALKLRSLDHIHVLVVVEPKFGFVKNKEVCLRRLRLLPRQLDWKKALAVWQRLSGFQGEPHTRRPDEQLEVIELNVGPAPGPAAAALTADSVREMVHSLRQPVRGTRPDETALEEEGKGEPAPEKKGAALETAETAAGDGAASQTVREKTEATGEKEETTGEKEEATGEKTETTGEKTETTGEKTETTGEKTETTGEKTEDAGEKTEAVREQTEVTGEQKVGVPADVNGVATVDSTKVETPTKALETEPSDPQRQTDGTVTDTEARRTAGTAADAEETGTREDQPAETPAEMSGTPSAETQTADTAASEDASEPRPAAGGSGTSSAQIAPPPAGAVSFRATCYRAGGGKQGHSFTSNDGAKNFGGAVQELFNWKVQMKGYDLEVILDVDFDMVSVGLSLTPQALFYRNLVKMGPTSLRSTVCYCLLMMAKPQPYEVVVDPMCGGGSISLEGAQAFPGTFHLCGDNYPDAAPRVALNREFSARQLSPSAQLAVDVLTWDCTRLPLRDGCADVIVSDLPFGKRMGSKFDNRTLYPACMEEMGRICTPRYGRAVLLTQDRRTMEKTLHLGRVKSLWRCRASPYVNIGGLDGCAYFLQRTDFVRRQRPPPPRSAPPAAAPQRGPPSAERAPGAESAPETAADGPSSTGAVDSPATGESGDALPVSEERVPQEESGKVTRVGTEEASVGGAVEPGVPESETIPEEGTAGDRKVTPGEVSQAPDVSSLTAQPSPTVGSSTEPAGAEVSTEADSVPETPQRAASDAGSAAAVCPGASAPEAAQESAPSQSAE